MATNKEQFDTDMNELSDAINEKTGGTELMTISEMKEAVKGINNVDLSGYLKTGIHKDEDVFMSYKTLTMYGNNYAEGLTLIEDNTSFFGGGSTIFLRDNDVSINNKSFNKLYEDVQLLKGSYDLLRPSNGMLYTYGVDSTMGKYAMISQVGGMSYKSNNLIIVDDVAETTNSKGITYKVENGVITLNGTATSAHGINLKLKTPLPVGTYTLQNFGGLATNGNGVVGIANSSYSMTLQINMHVAPIYKTTTITSEGVYLTIYANTGATFSNHQLMPMVVKGSTRPTEFESGFEGIRHAKVTDVLLNHEVIIPLNNFYTMNGYGIGINDTCYNYLDFDKDVLVRKVGSYTFTGSETLTNSTISDASKYQFIFNSLQGKIKPNANDTAGNILMDGLEAVSVDSIYATVEGIGVNKNGVICIHKDGITTNNDMKTYLTGKTIYFELLEPIENALPQIDTIFDTSKGGIITFENEHKKAVPYEIKYIKVV